MEPVTYRNILVPLDGSKRAEDAVPVGGELARRFGARLYLLVAFNLTGRLFVPEGQKNLPSHYQKLRLFEIEEIGEFLKDKACGLTESGVTVECLVVEDDPADAIVNSAIQHEVDLIVMTSHGQRGWTRWISGSVTESVLRRAPCPVLVLRKGQPLL